MPYNPEIKYQVYELKLYEHLFINPVKEHLIKNLIIDYTDEEPNKIS